MLALKIYRRQNDTHIYVLEADVSPKTHRLVYRGGAVHHPRWSSLLSKVASVAGAECVTLKLHQNMEEESVWRVPVGQHDALVARLRTPVGDESKEAAQARLIEVVPPHVLQLLERAPDRVNLTTPEIAERVGAELWATLMPFQREGVEFIIRNRGRGLILDQMGLGKTLQGLGVLAFYAQVRPAVVVCPASVKVSWKTHIQQHLHTEPHVMKTWKNDFDAQRINILSFGMFNSKQFQDKLKLFKPQMVVVDESHYIKTAKSARTKHVFQWAQQSAHVVLLTGTPLSRPVELYSQIKCINKNLFKAFFHYQQHQPRSGVVTSLSPPDRRERFYFANRYCRPDLKFARGTKAFAFRGSENESELHAILKQHVAIRRTKQQVLKDLPPKLREKVVIDEFVQDIPVEFNTDEQFMELIRDTAVRKLPHIDAYLKDIVAEELKNDPRLKVLLWGHHRIVLDQLETSMKAVCPESCVVRMDGSTSLVKRAQYVQAFQTDPQVRVAVLSLTAMAAGVTLTAATLSIFTELWFSPDTHLQAEDRCHRIGTVDPVCIRYLSAAGSTDDILWNMLQRKTKLSAMTIDGREAYLGADVKKTSELRAELEDERGTENDDVEEEEDEEQPKRPAKRTRRAQPEPMVDDVDFDTLE